MKRTAFALLILCALQLSSSVIQTAIGYADSNCRIPVLYSGAQLQGDSPCTPSADCYRQPNSMGESARTFCTEEWLFPCIQPNDLDIGGWLYCENNMNCSGPTCRVGVLVMAQWIDETGSRTPPSNTCHTNDLLLGSNSIIVLNRTLLCQSWFQNVMGFVLNGIGSPDFEQALSRGQAFDVTLTPGQIAKINTGTSCSSENNAKRQVGGTEAILLVLTIYASRAQIAALAGNVITKIMEFAAGNVSITQEGDQTRINFPCIINCPKEKRSISSDEDILLLVYHTSYSVVIGLTSGRQLLGSFEIENENNTVLGNLSISLSYSMSFTNQTQVSTPNNIIPNNTIPTGPASVAVKFSVGKMGWFFPLLWFGTIIKAIESVMYNRITDQ